VAHLRLKDLDLAQKRILVRQGKGNKDRVVYVSNDADRVLRDYLKSRSASKIQEIFLVNKGTCRGMPISIRGIQKRMEYYARKTGLEVSCHQLRHTMATQLLNADADLVTIQDLLGHARIKTTQRYAKIFQARGTFFSISLFESADLRCLHAKSRAVRFPWTFAACDGQGYRKEGNIS